MSSHEKVCEGARPQLRLFTGGSPQEDSERPAGWTMWDVFELLLLPDLRRRDRSPATIGEYRTALKFFDQWLLREGAKYGIANPLLRDVSRASLEAFRDYVVRQRDVSHRTANKRVDSLLRILKFAAGREEVAEYEAAPEVAALEHTPAESKLYFRYEQLDRMYEAAGRCEWPDVDRDGQQLDAPAQWRAALVIFFCYGQRTQELIRYESRKESLTWGQIWPEPESPADDGHARCEHGWFTYVPTKQKRHKPQPLVLPISSTVAAHLKAISPQRSALSQMADGPIFNWPLTNGPLYEEWKRLLRNAKVTPKPDPATGRARRFLIKHLRKTCETWYAHHFGKEVAEAIVGHSARSVSSRHYINLEERVLEAVTTLPLPASFGEIFRAGQQQMLLF